MDANAERPFGSRYEPLRKIARGGMADVYEARDTLLDRPVALKVLFSELSVNEAFVERFRREAQSAANLAHPNVVSVFDWGRDRGTYYIVMELVAGQTLAKLIRESGPLPPAQVAAIGADVAGALAFAHRHGVIHRDIKPSNVLITPEGDVKVADFGIARAATSDGDLTQTGSILGTATYISPEQAQGEVLDGRSDVYSLGVVLYEMATGATPFTGESPLSIAYKHVSEVAPPPSTLNSKIPADLEAVIMSCLAKSPADRYDGATELREDLLRFSQGKAVEAPPLVGLPTQLVPGTYLSQSDSTIGIPVVAAAETEESNNRGRNIAIGVALLIALLAALLFIGAATGLFSSKAVPIKVNVPSVVGLSKRAAVSQLSADGLKSSAQTRENSAKAGTVVGQSPSAGASIQKGSTVALTVSSGPALVRVPSVVNQNISSAESTLLGMGFNVVTDYTNTNSVPSGTVTAQNPTGGSSVPKGSNVTLTVSNGPSQVAVPNVVGDQISQAANTLSGDHLSVGNVTSQDSTQPANTVLSQSPVAGTNVQPHSSVDLVVSNGTAPTTTTTTTTTAPTTTTTTTAPTTTTTTTAPTTAG